MALSHTCEKRNTPELNVLYKNATVNGISWKTWLYELSHACHGITQQYVGTSRFDKYHCYRYAREIIKRIHDDEAFSNVKHKDTLKKLCIVTDHASDALFLPGRSRWDMCKVKLFKPSEHDMSK